MRRTPLESWVSEKIFGYSGRALTLEDVRGYQLKKLRETIDYISERSPFYRKRLSGLSGKDLSRLEDLSAFPFTTMEDVHQSGPQFLCVSQSAVQRIVTVSLPNELQKTRRLSFTGEDLELTIDFFHRGMATLVNPEERVLILMPGERPDSVGDLLAKGLARGNVLGYMHGVVQDPTRTIAAIVNLKIDCLVGIPTQVLALARHERAEEIPESRIKSVLLSADYVPSAIVNEIRRVWNCAVFSHYGTTEMGLGGGVDCEAFAGYHLREADLFFEIVDPVSGQPQPVGQAGEIVFTTLTRAAMPLLRYRTGDLSRFLLDPCPCGTVLQRLEKVKGKVNDMVWLQSGQWLGMADLDEALFSVPGIVNYVPTLIKTADVDRLEVVIHPASHEDHPRSEEIAGVLMRVPAIASSVKAGHLTLGPIRFTSENWITTGVAKRAILQRGEEE